MDEGAGRPDLRVSSESEGWRREAAFAERLQGLPAVTLVLVAIMAGLHLWLEGESGDGTDRLMFQLLVAGAKVNALISSGEWWRLISSAFLHGSFVHLLVNSLAVLLLGFYVEKTTGPSCLLLSFVFSAVAGGAVSFAWGNGASVGASGGMFGLLSTMLVMSLLRWREIPSVARPYAVGLPAVVGAMTVGYGFIAGNVDNAAHLGGASGGVLVACLAHVGARYRGFRPAIGLVVLLALLATAYSLTVTCTRLAGRFALPETRLTATKLPDGKPVHVPAAWKTGVLKEGRCEVGRMPDEEAVLCLVDPYFSMLLVASGRRLEGTPVHAEYVRRERGQESVEYAHDTILWGADPERGVQFALLAFDGIAVSYGPLFAAVQTAPPNAGR
ncbi:MAG: rhomboid family intramembrane serine protease [Deltaproteobacteria bacterium]|nr:rhomboid family intramembrane serine protease [Deltaproteobacteria bacterium]